MFLDGLLSKNHAITKRIMNKNVNALPIGHIVFNMKMPI